MWYMEMNIDKYKSKLLLDFPLLLFFYVSGLEHDSRLKRTTKKCVFMRSRCYSLPLCVCRAADAGEEEEEGGRVRQAVTSSVRCPPCISNHVSRIAVFFFLLVRVKSLCVWESLFFPAFQTRLLFSLSPFYPEFQFACPWEGIQIMHNTILGGAVKRPLLCFSWINHKQLQNIIRSRYFIRCLGCKFKNSPAVPPHLSLYIGTASHGAVLEMWFYLSERT